MPTIMITGAKRGIGRGLVDRFLEGGWQVVAAGRNIASTDLAALSGVTTLELDVTDDASIAAAKQALGDRPLDLLLNNAGVYDKAHNGFAEVTREAWEHELMVNTISPLMVSRAFLPNLRAGDRRGLAVISSQMGSIANNTSGSSYMYRSSKAAVNQVWKCLSLELGHEGFTCVTLHPGWVQTDMGGEQATLTVEQSTHGLFQVLARLSPDQNGFFLNFDGALLPW
jgi:NAD(P)-dependent dehydrogenase (short-subunit alcohol dehydrogenase family)